MSRIYTRVGENANTLRSVLVFILTTRGIPQIFYGTEILMGNAGTDSHGVIRSDFPGGWPGDEQNGFTGKGLGKEPSDMQSFIRKLLNWRKSASEVHHGTLKHYIPEDGTYVYFRSFQERNTMIVINKNKEEFYLKIERFRKSLKDSQRGKDIISGETHNLTKDILLKPETSLIIELNP
jgi:glycosidase